jgi:hypothetical protein
MRPDKVQNGNNGKCRFSNRNKKGEKLKLLNFLEIARLF